MPTFNKYLIQAEKVAKAKVTINAAIAGLVVIFISYALADAIVGALIDASGTG